MTDQELRALVRDAVQRHLGAAGHAGRSDGRARRAVHAVTTRRRHSSHAMYISLVNAGEACVIEPAVPCNHCNYCKSHGH